MNKPFATLKPEGFIAIDSLWQGNLSKNTFQIQDLPNVT